MEESPEEQMEVDVRESEEEDITQIEPPEENLPCILQLYCAKCRDHCGTYSKETGEE